MHKAMTAALVAVLVAGCGASPKQINQGYRGWVGQTEKAVTTVFGYPQRTTDLQSGRKVYEYSYGRDCTLQFEIGPQSVVDDVKVSGRDLGECPRKAPGGGKF